PDREVGGDTEAEGGLPHRRAGRADDQVARLKARGQAVELAEAAGDAGDIGARLVQRRDSLEAVLEQILDVRELARGALLRKVEDDLLGAVDELLGGEPLPLEPEARDLLPGAHEAAERGHLPDDLRVVAGIRRRRNEGGELVDARAAADLLE